MGEVTVIGEDTLDLSIPSCDGDPQVVSLTQDDKAVTVEVVATVQENGPACSDVLHVELDEPLGTREVIDATSGETLRTAVLEVVDRDDGSSDDRE